MLIEPLQWARHCLGTVLATGHTAGGPGPKKPIVYQERKMGKQVKTVLHLRKGSLWKIFCESVLDAN